MRALAVSPDERFVYAAGFLDGSLGVFAREPDGALVFVESITSLGGATALATSPDGGHIYVATRDSVAVFARRSDGRLRPTSMLGAAAIDALAISPDGRHLYATDASSGSVNTFDREPITGALTPRQSIDGLPGATAVTVSADGRFVYVASFSDSSVAAFARDPNSGVLSGIELHRDGIGDITGMSGPSALDLAPDGTQLYVAGIEGMAIFARDVSTGRLVFVETKSYFAATHACPPAPASAVRASRDGSLVLVARAGDAALAVFARDATSGMLVLADLYEDARGGRGCEGAFSLALATTGDAGLVLYASGLAPDRLSVFDIDPVAGSVTALAEKRNGVGGVHGLLGATAVTISPDDAHAYVAAPDAIVVLARDGAPGTVRYITTQRAPDGGFGPLSSLALSPDGRHLYAASTSDRLFVLSRDPATGRLVLAQELRNGSNGVAGLAGHSSVQVSPDGADVYVASAGDAAIAVFGRDPDNGALAFSGVHRQGAHGIDGLEGVTDLAIDASGRHVYIASAGAGGAVALFERNPGSGELVFVAVHRNRTSGVDGLAGAAAVVLAPDGGHVYLAGFLDAAIAIFARSPATGALGFAGVVRDPAGGGLTGVRDLSVAPAGDRLYAVASSGAVSVFSRNQAVGVLRLLDTLRNGDGGAAGLAGALAVALDGNGANAYVTGPIEAAVAVFATDR